MEIVKVEEVLVASLVAAKETGHEIRSHAMGIQHVKTGEVYVAYEEKTVCAIGSYLLGKIRLSNNSCSENAAQHLDISYEDVISIEGGFDKKVRARYYSQEYYNIGERLRKKFLEQPAQG